MGERGPAPAREEERRRTNEPAVPVVKMGPEELLALPFPINLNPEPPDPRAFIPEEVEDEDGKPRPHLGRDENGWHPYASELYRRLAEDPSRIWNGPAAQALDLIMCENLSRLLMPRYTATLQPTDDQPGEVIYERLPLNGSEMAAMLKWASVRGLYEADRLRIGKEITFYAADEREPAEAIPGGANVVSIKRNRAEALADRSAQERSAQ